MTTFPHDPKGYYSILGLAPGADASAIKAAYRARVKAVHPDRNKAAAAREEFQRIVEAYHVLCDRVARAEYDATGRHAETEEDDSIPAAPYTCTGCGNVTAQPRYVIFHQVKSFVLWARTSRLEGIFCRDCADHAAAKASTRTWTWGWWSVPGLLLAPVALIRNLLGGTKPKHENARILIRQARAFLARGDAEVARALIDQAAPFATHPTHRRQLEEMRARMPAVEGRRLRDRWRPLGGVFVAQALPLAALPLAVGLVALAAVKPWSPMVAASASIAVPSVTVGEIRHAAIDDLKLRQAPIEGAPVLTLLDRFTSVEVTATTDSPDWVQVQAPSGVTGYVQTRFLYAGSASRLKQEWCAENQGHRPEAGEVLIRRASGDHRLLIHNDGRHDAVVKLKTLQGTTVQAFYVPATYHMGLGGLPPGTFRIEFATGSSYSRGCGLFVEDMETAVIPLTLTFRTLPAGSRHLGNIPEIWLVAPPDDVKAPQPLAIEKFLADD